MAVCTYVINNDCLCHNGTNERSLQSSICCKYNYKNVENINHKTNEI